MRKILIVILASAIGLATAPAVASPAPEFTHDEPEAWINSEPIEISDLRGKVVLIDFWAYMCWNCYRSFPWLTDMESRLPDDAFQIIGVHTPEFDAEKRRRNVVEKAHEFGLHHPIMLDNDYSYWDAMNNRFWPTYYLIGKQGDIRDRFIGETHAGDSRARKIESRIRKLLAE